MNDIIEISSIEEAVSFYTNDAPDHPLIHIIDLSTTNLDKQFLDKKICSQLYSVAVKKNFGGKLRYGRQHYDFDRGVLTAFGPGQIIEITEMYERGELEGWFMTFHPDLLLRHSLSKEIKTFGYFSYDVFEALHLSEKEQKTLNKLVDDIRQELQQNQDQFSLDIILANLDLVLKYINRFFGRQFLTRKTFNIDEVERCLSIIETHVENAAFNESGLLTVKELALEMNMSANYLSDMLKCQTGKSAQEHIHDILIEKAKYMLLNSNASVATIAYQLGFDYPQYFSRMFKKKTSMTPAAFRQVN